ncbi:MAG: aspartyl/asparaginyl beta-hydroxylase domain-containing protein [Rhodothermales bacterium]
MDEEKKTFRERSWRVFKQAGFKTIQMIEKGITRFSLVGDKTFFDNDIFPWTREIEANWRVIRAELDEILKERASLPSFHDISKDQVLISTDDKWKTYFLYGYGYKSEKNCARCPETTRLVEQVPGMKTAFFSILAPGKHIPHHRGPYKGLLRYHLGLQVPEPKEKCRIRVGDDIRHWEEGKGMVFDDTYDHEVWNDTDGQRVVLFMDVIRPFRQPIAALNKGVIKLVGWSPYVQNARKNLDAWEQDNQQPATAQS